MRALLSKTFAQKLPLDPSADSFHGARGPKFDLSLHLFPNAAKVLATQGIGVAWTEFFGSKYAISNKFHMLADVYYKINTYMKHYILIFLFLRNNDLEENARMQFECWLS